MGRESRVYRDKDSPRSRQAQGALSERPDLVIVPGGGWLQARRRACGGRSSAGRSPRPRRPSRGRQHVASISTGALLLARAGVLDGRRATTNPGALDDLRAYGGIEVPAARVVDDGDVLTAGSPACGLDLGLRLLERAGGPGLAEAAARALRYERPAVEVG